MKSIVSSQLNHYWRKPAVLAAVVASGLGVGGLSAQDTNIFKADLNGNRGAADTGPVQSGWTGISGTQSINGPWTATYVINGIMIEMKVQAGNAGWRSRGPLAAQTPDLREMYQSMVFAAGGIDLKLTGLTAGQTYKMNLYGWDSDGGNVGDAYWKYSLAGDKTNPIDAGYLWQPSTNSFNPAFNTGVTLASKGTGALQTSFTATGPSVDFFTAGGPVIALNGFELYQVVSSSLPPDAASSTVTASPAVVVANGTSTATVTVVLNDSNHATVEGKTVTLASSRGAADTISAASGPSGATGVVTFTVSSATPGTSTYTATATTDDPEVVVNQTATVVFTGPPTAAESTVVASPASVLGNGTSTSTVTVTLNDVNSQAIAGKTVTLARNGNTGVGSPVIAPASATTNASGQAVFTVKCSTSGDYDFEATDTTDSMVVTQKATVTFTEIPPADGALSTLTASPATVMANGIATSTITVTLLDSNSMPVSGKTVTLASDRGATDTISAASGPSSLAGVVTFTVKSLTAGTPVFTATDVTDSVIVGATTSVTFTWAPLVANAGSAKTVGDGYPVVIGGSPTASGGNGEYTYGWSPATGLDDPTAANPVASPTETTVYTVTVTDTVHSTPATSSVTVTYTMPNANLISVDVVVGLGTGTGPCAGDTLTTGTTMKNAAGNIYSGQLGNWNHLAIGTYNQSSAITSLLKNGGGAVTTAKLAFGTASGLTQPAAGNWRCNPNDGPANSIKLLRSESAYLYYPAITSADHYAWAITGLTPSTSYKLTLFGVGAHASTTNVAFPGTDQQVAAVKDSEGDWDWASITSDANGKIIGTFTAPSGTPGIQGMQIEGPMPLLTPLVASAGTNQSVSEASPSAVIGGSPTASGGSGTYTYSWSPVTGLSSATVANPTATPAETTTYTVTVSDGVSTPATSAVIVTVGTGSAYDAWALLHAGGQSASEDYDGDNVPNGVEFFIGADDGMTTLPVVIEGKVTWPHVREVASFEVQVSNDLATWTSADLADVDTSVAGEVTYTLPTGAAKKFCRLMVVP